MSRPSHTSPAEPVVQSFEPAGGGWHCSHLFYSFDRGRLKKLSADERAEGCRQFAAVLDPAGSDAPIRLQSSITSGQKADFGLMMLDPDPLKIDRVHQRLMASQLGPALEPRYSFVSMTEISEYVQSPEQFGERLVAEGMDPNGAEYKTRLKGYSDRLVEMNRQRLTPDFSPYRATCFYPMNKKRKGGSLHISHHVKQEKSEPPISVWTLIDGENENWYTLPKEDRLRMMIEHAKSGMAFAGKVSQLITVGLGLENWEWGVTLWAANPEYLKEIVYKMRFDEASARYAEFGAFYTGYVSTPADIMEHCMIPAK